MRRWMLVAAAWLCGAHLAQAPLAQAQTLEQRLLQEGAVSLAEAARQHGDAQRGAILFYQPYLACTKCHQLEGPGLLGPNLAGLPPGATDVYLVESLLEPSKAVKPGYEVTTVVTAGGKTIAGLTVKREGGRVVFRDAARGGQLVTLTADEVEELIPSTTSLMPAGQVNQLASRQQFLDLVRYLIEIVRGGPRRARELEPPPALYAARPLPAYEQHIDHAGMIAGLNKDSLQRGRAIYERLCVNCHGTHDKPGSLPTSLRFASGQFKNGSDPYTMYQTLTRGFGMMVPQTWMVPQQKYDVIHYIREAYLKEHNAPQYFRIDRDYLAGLPQGDTRGPQPSNIVPWQQMDYGPNLVATYEIGSDGANFAYKGNAIRLDAGPGGVTRGRYWMVFDYDTLRMAAAYSGQGFIDFNGINFNGRHNVHPRVVGEVHVANPTGAGWADAGGSFHDPRLRGRDKRPYGPLPRAWAHYRGMYYHGQKVVLSYSVHGVAVLELPGWQDAAEGPVFTRTFNLAQRPGELTLQVARRGEGSAWRQIGGGEGGPGVAVLQAAEAPPAETAAGAAPRLDGGSYFEVARPRQFDLTRRDYTITARIKTRQGGTIFAKTAPQPKWVPNGKTFFVRGGRLCFDIGWVGVVQSRARVADGRWHDVAMTFRHQDGQVQLYVDGVPDAAGRLKPKAEVQDHVVRIGFTAGDFPQPQSFFDGQLQQVRYYARALSTPQIAAAAAAGDETDGPAAAWNLDDVDAEQAPDASGNEHHARYVVGAGDSSAAPRGLLLAGIAGDVPGAAWSATPAGDLRLTLPAGPPLKFTLWTTQLDQEDKIEPLLAALAIDRADRDLQPLTRGGPPRWPQRLTTTAALGPDDGPFAVDVLTHPADNPWFCRLRLTGFDFFPDGDRAAVSSWDGSVWLVRGLSRLGPQAGVAAAAADGGEQPVEPNQLTWQRIASGLFQPLGVKIVGGKIFVTCRDQICILHDVNGDDEIDFYENFNNDHQVTEHFHEFAMGLQTDQAGNFYYAKSARHALPALVPHHGTLLRVTPGGERTDIVATGFRAANGVCVNPDGTFVVTDQEGHWNPKNRINWVHEGGFYGNMFGYHDVTDSSDAAMEPPLCWITNAFDRSPAELLWVDSPRWGPLDGKLLNLSYGYGKVYVVPHEEVDGRMQGGMCELPLPQFPTGVMRGRFHPVDGQLYACGMFAWAGNQQQPGGFYRIRKTDRPAHLPVGLSAKQGRLEIQFSRPLAIDEAARADNYSVKTWSLKRTANYGSKHYDERYLKVAAAHVSEDGRHVQLEIPEIQPTWCMEVKYTLQAAGGDRVKGTIHNTIHALGD